MFKNNTNRILFILGLLILIIGLIIIKMFPPTDPTEKLYVEFSLFAVISPFIILWVYELTKKSDKKQKQKIANGILPILESNCTHISGLASFVAEGTIKVFVDKLKFSVGGIYYSLPIERIVSAEIMTQKQTEYITTQKLSRAVLGGLVFGDIGALIGGMPKSEAIETTEENLVITYTKDDDVEFIVLKNLPCKKVIRAIEQNVDLKPRHIDL